MELFRGRGEIINVDSVQVYRKLDIGSAKPSPEYLRNLPHHLINIRDYTEQFNTADFVRMADRAVRDIHSRGLIPVLAGGTAFYFKNFCQGFSSEAPGRDDTVRSALEGEADARGLDALWSELQEKDPLYAGKIHRHDRLRIIRALEVCRLTGRTLSSFEQGEEFREEYDYCLIGLERERDELYERIDRRVDIMFREGLADEVRSLIADGAREDDPGMHAIGYGEFFEMERIGCLTLGDTADRIKRNSRRYAKRQLTFFKSLPGVEWCHPGDKEKILKYIERFPFKEPLSLLT